MPQALATIDHPPAVYSRNDEATTDSRYVAKRFGKRHDDVLKAVRRLHCSADFRARNFAETVVTEKIGIAERPVRVFEMTKNGFIFLAMGFTGELAGTMKEAYIAEFDAMENEIVRIRSAPTFDPNDPAVLRQTLLGYTERVIALTATVEAQKAEIAVAAPKARFYDDFADAQGRIILTDLGRVLGVGPIVLIRHLVEKGVLFRTSKGAPLRASSDYLRRGWFETKSTIVGDVTRVQTYATPRGLQGIAEMLGRPVDLFGRTTLSRSLPMTQH